MKSRSIARSCLALPFLLQFGYVAHAQSKGSSSNLHWVATWASAQQQAAAGRGGRGPAAPQAKGQPPAPQAPAAPATPPRGTLVNQTARMILRTSIGGSKVRVQFSNAFGTAPVDIGGAHVAIHAKDSAIVSGSDRALTFNGKPNGRIVPGGVLVSDPVDLKIPKLSELAISVFVPGDSGVASQHSMALHTTYLSKEGDTTAVPEMTDSTTSTAWYWVSSVDVLAPANAAAIVAYGDSITDGATSSVNTNHSWPSLLAERLAANPATANLSVLNLGISGNRILGDGAGVSALARFDRDVLSQAGVKYLMILEGINDMNGAARGGATPGPALTADDLIGAMKQMIERAHTHGIKVIGCTLTPYGNGTDAVEAMRQSLNTFIRTSGAFDAVVDFDKVIRDPSDQRQFIKEYNNTDKLHPNDAGYKAMADAVNLSIFTSRTATSKK